MLENIQPPFGGCFLYRSYPSPNIVIPAGDKTHMRLYSPPSGPTRRMLRRVGDYRRGGA